MTMLKTFSFSLFIIISCFQSLSAQEGSLMHDGIERTYILHLPDSYSIDKDYPLVVAMHGGTGSAANLQNQSRLSEKADESDFIVVYPDGVRGGFNVIRTWNAGWCCGHASINDIDDVGFINKLLDKLMAENNIDVNRVYATGMSNGGYLSYRLACEIGHRFAAIAPVACSMSFVDCASDSAVPIIHFHSFLDVNVRYEGGYGEGLSDHYSPPIDSVLNVWAGFNQCSDSKEMITANDEFSHYRWSSCTCDSNIDLYISTDGGHSWPGGRKTLLGDPTSEHINANDLMWEFFTQHSLDCRTNPVEEQISVNRFPVFPNPTTSHLNIESELQQTSYFIVSSKGDIENVSIINSNSIDVRHLLPGVYFLLIKDEAARIASSSRFIKL